MPDSRIANAAEDGSAADDRTLVLERVFRASPDRVFQAWTDPETLVRWWGPEGMTTPDYDLDVREGGAWTTTMMDPDGNRFTVSGVYREIAPPDRLVLTWAWRQEDGTRGHETEIVVTFEDVPEGTKLRLVQSLFQAREQRENHFGGWTSSLNDLERLFG